MAAASALLQSQELLDEFGPADPRREDAQRRRQENAADASHRHQGRHRPRSLRGQRDGRGQEHQRAAEQSQIADGPVSKHRREDPPEEPSTFLPGGGSEHGPHPGPNLVSNKSKWMEQRHPRDIGRFESPLQPPGRGPDGPTSDTGARFGSTPAGDPIPPSNAGSGGWSRDGGSRNGTSSTGSRFRPRRVAFRIAW